jgi:hypothetical protein
VQARQGERKLKGKAMKVSRIGLLAALGMVAMTLPAAAAPAVSDSTDARGTKPALIQLAQQNQSRAANEARGGNYKKAKKPKKKKKMGKKK